MSLRNDLVASNDFMGIYEKWENANKRWKDYWFDAFCEVREYCKNEVDKVFKIVNDTLEIVFKKVRKKYSYDIELTEDVDESKFIEKGGEKVYLFEFFDKNDTLVCSKVGTTTRTVRQRLREELRSKTYSSMGCVSAVVYRIYDCGDVPAEGLESRIRAEYIKKYPRSFKKNDRFINERFDFDECDKLVKNYLRS